MAGISRRCHLRGRREAVRREGEPAEPPGTAFRGWYFRRFRPFFPVKATY